MSQPSIAEPPRTARLAGWFSTLLLTALTALIVSVLPRPVAAQQDDLAMKELLDQVDMAGKAFDKSPVPQSSVAEVNRQVHWRLWKRVFANGDPGEDELTALDHDGRSIGHLNQPGYAMAVTALALRQEESELAGSLFRSAQQLAPDLPYPYLAEASYVWRTDPGKVTQWADAFARGAVAGAVWPDTSFPWALKLMVYLLAAFGAASVLFVVGQLIRYFGIVAFDTARFLPQGFSSNQAVILLLAIIVVPGLLLQSPLLSVLILLAIVSFPQRLNERFVTALIFGLLMALPTLDGVFADLASYQGSLTQRLSNAQYVRCDAACREELEAKLQKRADDPFLRYTVLLAGYRTGEPAALDRIIEDVGSTEWPSELEGYALNLRGAALIAKAKPGEAVDVLNKARRALPGKPAPPFNLMRAHQMQENVDEASAALREASAHDVGRVARYLGYERRDVNSFMMAEPLSLELFWEYHRRYHAPTLSPMTAYWKSIAGAKFAFGWLPVGGAAGLVLLVVGLVFERRDRTSQPCPKCGLARSPSDRDTTGNHQFCLPCYRTYVTGAGLSYEARVHNERILSRRERFQELGRRMLSVVLPGVGHHMAGHAITGFIVTFLLAFGGLVILRPMGIVRPPDELLLVNWAGQVTIAWILVSIAASMAIWAASRDVAPLKPRGVK